MNTKNLFFVGVIVSASGLISPPIALLAGLIYGLSFAHPYTADSKKLSTFLLQASIVLLGFGMNLNEVIRAGRHRICILSALSITFALIVGAGHRTTFQRALHPSLLISTGTAICGGSAVAAVGPVVNAGDEEMAVSLGTVFVLNSTAAFLFPAIGYGLHLSQAQIRAVIRPRDSRHQFGRRRNREVRRRSFDRRHYGCKLARALWIVPLAFAIALFRKEKKQIKWPWFILFFCFAAVATTYLPLFGPLYPKLSALGKAGLTVTLYLIGTGISKSTLKQVGVRPLLQGVLLWAIVATLSLVLIRFGVISL